jgi:hypothetical protein
MFRLWLDKSHLENLVYIIYDLCGLSALKIVRPDWEVLMKSLSMSGESNHREHLGPEFWNLCMLSALPLLDGYFLAFLTSDLWKDWRNALAFGLTAFSGGGCVYVAMNLRGTVKQRIAQVVSVYIGLALGALMVSLARPFFESFLPDNVHLFTAMLLLGLGLCISGVPWLRRIAQWAGLQYAFRLIIFASLCQGLFIKGIKVELSLDWTLLPALAVSVSAGLGLTVVGVVLGLFLAGVADQRLLQIGAGISLALMGFNLLGAGFPSVVVISPLVLGCLWTMAHATTQGLSRSLRAWLYHL